MDNLDEIIKNQMIPSYENNATFRNQIINTFNSHYTQNIKYHIMWLFFHSFSFAYPVAPWKSCAPVLPVVSWGPVVPCAPVAPLPLPWQLQLHCS